MKAAFDMPEQLTQLNVRRLNETTLRPDTPVVCLNRGRVPLETTFDGNHIPIPVGHFVTEWGAAQHMKDRLIVPGTRNLQVGGFVSWIAVLGSEDQRIAVDKPEDCLPFTDEELQAFGESIEGLSREGRDQLQPVRVQQARAMSRTQGVGGGLPRPSIDAGQQVTEAAAEAAEHVFDPPDESATREAEAVAASDGVAPVRQRKK